MKPTKVRVLPLLLAAAAALTFTSCNPKQTPSSSPGGETTGTPSATTTLPESTDPSDDTSDTAATDNTTIGGTDMDAHTTTTTTRTHSKATSSTTSTTPTTKPTAPDNEGPDPDNTDVESDYTVTGIPMGFITSSPKKAFQRVTDNQIKVYDKKQLDDSKGTVISIVPSQANQSILGFGASITESAAYSLYQIPQAERDKVMERLFDPNKGIGLSFIRNTIGSSDFALTGEVGAVNAAGLPIGPYTYDDMADDQEDWELEHFSIKRDLSMVVPLTKQALALNPKATIMASPWTPPPWMKTENTHYGYVTVDGKQQHAILREDCYEVYANYFVKYIQAMEKEGIPIYAVTPQNEPGQSIHYPSMKMTLDEQITFVRDYLSPAFKKNGLDTKILGLDDNWHTYANALTLLFNAADAFDGVAFHSYSSNGTAQNNIYTAFPEKEIVVTEGSGLSNPFLNSVFYHGNRIISSLRNQGKGYILWNLALSNKKGPLTYQPGSKCDPLIMVNYVGDDNTETYKDYGYTSEYYVLAHFSKFIRPGARQVFSSEASNVTNVACLNEDGTLASVITNTSIKPVTVKLVIGDKVVEYTIPASTIVTLVWDANK